MRCFTLRQQGDVEEDFGLNFTVTGSAFGVNRVIELVPNGAHVPVSTVAW